MCSGFDSSMLVLHGEDHDTAAPPLSVVLAGRKTLLLSTLTPPPLSTCSWSLLVLAVS